MNTKIIVITTLLYMVCYGSAAQPKGTIFFERLSKRNALIGGALTSVSNGMKIQNNNINVGNLLVNPSSFQKPDSTIYKRIQTYKSQTAKLIGANRLFDLQISDSLKLLKYNLGVLQIQKGDSIIGIKNIRLAADGGLAKAQYTYALYNYLGKYIQKNLRMAYKYFEKAAKQNHPASCYILGDANYFGIDGFKKDSTEAFKWYKKSADNGYTIGQITTGNLYFNAKNTLDAIKYWENAIDNPNVVKEDDMSLLAQSAYNVGWFYYFGQGIEKNESKGVKYFKDAADYGDSQAAYIVGRIYEAIDFTQKDEELANAYIRKSALLSYPEAEAVYGDYCQFGIGMKRDSVQSIYWYKKAYDDGYTQTAYPLAWHYANTNLNDSIIYWGTKPEARDSVDIQYAIGAVYYNKEDYDNAEMWWKKAAAQNEVEAFWGMYLIEDLINQDSVAGFEYLQKAYELGKPEAICDMGWHYLYGCFVQKDIDMARDLFLRAGDAGCGIAYCNLGSTYYSKEYTKKPKKETAADYWEESARLGCPEGQYNYGMALKRGIGRKKDKEGALYWIKLSAQNGDEDAKRELQKMLR